MKLDYPSLVENEMLPMYHRLADKLRKLVFDGQLKPGDKVMSENALAKNYSISVGTVRNALGILVQEGLLIRIYGKGTFVKHPNFDKSLLRFFRFKPTETTFILPRGKILSKQIKPIPNHVANCLKVVPNTKGIKISRIRLINDDPVLVEEIWLVFELFKPFFEMKNEDIGDFLYPIYDYKCGKLITCAKETLTAEVSNSRVAKFLNTKDNNPLIVVERVASGYGDKPLEWRRSYGLVKHFSYHIEIN